MSNGQSGNRENLTVSLIPIHCSDTQTYVSVTQSVQSGCRLCLWQHTSEQGCGQQQSSVYSNNTLWSLLKVQHMERHTEGVSDVLDNTDAVCSSESPASRRHERNWILQAWLRMNNSQKRWLLLILTTASSLGDC